MKSMLLYRGSIIFMYTFSLSYPYKPRRFFKEWAPETAIIHDSVKESGNMSPESIKKVEEFAQRVVSSFEKDKAARDAFLNSIDGIKQDVFKSPEMFRAFINRAYEKYASELAKLAGHDRTEKIEDFSVFIYDVMLQFADINNMKRFALAMGAQKKALEQKYGLTTQRTADATSTLRGEL
jgi:hypothetical protein